MWPQTLQMSEDDCRSTLRRLELETYSNVVGVFRAQGGLSDRKTKLLEELRSVFHISQDRHRAEARRVANDELLSTIAKSVSGPNTWQEWSREGRRSYPMLPRVAPQTALGWIANKLANEVALENAKLPLPAETAAAAAEEQAVILAANAAAEAAAPGYAERYLVTSDPFKTPDIPAAGIKKNLKRGMNDSHQVPGSGSSKKRNINDSPSSNKHKHITGTGTTNTPPTSSNRKNAAHSRVQQQRFFYQQQQKAKKLAKAAATKREKLPGASKCGRKSKKFKEQLREEQEYQRQQQELLQQQQQQLEEEYPDNAYENYASTNTSSNIVVSDTNLIHTHEQQIGAEDSKFVSNQKVYLPLIMPQIAASKRDITRNLTKLQLPGNSATTQISNQLVAAQSAPSIGSPISGTTKTIVDSKLTPLSTPVQKYIVEDRQSPAITQHAQTPNPAVAGSATATTPTPTTPFMTMPHLPVSNKLRPINTTVLPPGTKLSTTTKKLAGATILSATLLSPNSTTSPLSENVISNANASTHLYNVMEGSSTIVQSGSNQGNISISSSQQPPPTPPTHTPPAVIQLHGNEVVRSGTQQSAQSITAATTPSQGKVLTTKILPIVFGNSPTSSGNSIKNGAGVAGTTASNFVTNSPGATIIKSLPPSVLVSGQQSGNILPSGSSSFSTFANTGQVYRKHPNILKSTSSLRSSSNNSGGPQIISNIRLTPAITTSSTTNPTQSTNLFQQQLRISQPSTGIRTSVKICQSPNGKVFIQPANVDPSKITKITSGHLAQRIVPSTLLGSSSNTSLQSTNVSVGGNTISNQTGSGHRIAIQKVQIIPAPISGNNAAASRTTTLSLGGSKTNIFVPSTTNLRPTKSISNLTLPKGSFTSAATGMLNDNSGGSGFSKHTTDVLKSSNVVVIDAANKLSSQHPNISTSNLNRSINSSHMITEDTPVDIIVDESSDIAATGLTSTNENSSITAVLASNLTENHTQPQLLTPEKQTTSTVVPITVLSTTDWEMELDQATAANSLQQQQHLQQQQQQSSSTIDVSNYKVHEQSESEFETAERIITDESFEDVIIEEEEEEDEEGGGDGDGNGDGDVDGEFEDTDEEEHEYNASELDIDVAADNDIIMIDDVETLSSKFENEDTNSNLESYINKGIEEVKKIIDEATEINKTQSYTISQDNNSKNNINQEERRNHNEGDESTKQEIDDEEVDNDIQTTTLHNHHDNVDQVEERISPPPVIESEVTSANDISSIDASSQEVASETTLVPTTTTGTVTPIATTVSGSVVSVQDLDESKTNIVKSDDEIETTLNTTEGTNCSTRDELHIQTDQ